jgi:hypothetical protein
MILRAMAEEKTQTGDEKKPAIVAAIARIWREKSEPSKFKDGVDCACRLKVNIEIMGFSKQFEVDCGCG